MDYMGVWSKRVVGPWLIVLLLALSGGPLGAKGGSGKVQTARARLRATLREKQRVEEKLHETKQLQRHALHDVRSSEERLETAQTALRRTEVKLAATERRVKVTQDRIGQVDAQLKQHNAALWKRLEVFYKKGSVGYAEVVLGATSFEDFVDRAILFKSVTKHDLELKQNIEEARSEQVALKADLVQSWREYADLRSQYDEKTREISVETGRKKLVLADVRRDRAAQEEALEEISNAQSEIERVLGRLQNPGGGSGGGGRLSGGFNKPCSGRYTCRFGSRIHPITGRRSFHDGVDIADSYGTTIHAAAAGTVVQSGWHSRVYGNAVMIDHGNGWATFYGHCSRVLVSEGQHVSQGQAIASMGSTGWSTGSHCHFSVYRNGSAVNPLSLR
ncbi:MAG: peptidoglycan DD-metalloendopeptidase family protein [Armatimonadetes bacterium]|nr:peptidoglycan DD-metalloendopeptidase family protein [Armatimonadota bacterium]